MNKSENQSEKGSASQNPRHDRSLDDLSQYTAEEKALILHNSAVGDRYVHFVPPAPEPTPAAERDQLELCSRNRILELLSKEAELERVKQQLSEALEQLKHEAISRSKLLIERDEYKQQRDTLLADMRKIANTHVADAQRIARAAIAAVEKEVQQ